MALRIAGACAAKKGQKLAVLDMRNVAGFCDYFVIVSATSLRQVNAIAEAIQADLAKDKIKPLSRAASHDESGWAVLDFSSVVAHIFFGPVRDFYALEHLWSDAKKVRIPKSVRGE